MRAEDNYAITATRTLVLGRERMNDRTRTETHSTDEQVGADIGADAASDDGRIQSRWQAGQAAPTSRVLTSRSELRDVGVRARQVARMVVICGLKYGTVATRIVRRMRCISDVRRSGEIRTSSVEMAGGSWSSAAIVTAS